MTAYPDGLLDARLELNLGGTWTDVTDAAMPDGAQDVDITGGTPDGAQQPDPVSATVTLDNPGGQFSPRNAASSYFGQLQQNTRARISVAGSAGTFLRMEDDRSSTVTTPLPAVTSGVLDVRMDLDPSDWQGCSIAGMAGWVIGFGGDTAGGLSSPPGYLDFQVLSSQSSALGAYQDAVRLPLGRQCLRVVFAFSTATVSFYSAPAGTSLGSGSWTLLESDYLGVFYPVGGAGLTIGSVLGRQAFAGKLYGLSVYGGAAGTTPLAYFDPTLRPPGTTTWTDSLKNTWTLTGTAQVTDRDYRVCGELASVVPTVDSSGANPRAQVQIAGPLRRIQAASAPPVTSPMTRAVLAQAGNAAPVAYWPMEDGDGSTSVASGLPGGGPMDVSGAPQYAADTSFAASKPLLTLGNAVLRGRVGAYSAPSGIAVRFCATLGTLPTAGYWPLLRLYFTGAACQLVTLRVYPSGYIGLTGFAADGSQWFDMGSITFDTAGPQWYSVEIVPSGTATAATIETLPVGSPTSYTYTTTYSGGPGKLFELDVNSNLGFTDTSFGQLSVQPSVPSMWDMAAPLAAYAGELAGNRFTRVLGEEGYQSRILGNPQETIAMGAQPIDTVQAILQDVENTDGGLLFEPRDSLSVGYRTLASMYNQAPALTLDYAAGNLPGSVQGADDDTDLVNDWTVSQPSGSSARATLDDPGVSTSTTRAGTYQNTAQANTSLPDALLDAAGRMLVLSAADEARYRQVAANAGIPGAPAAAIAALKVGDLLEIRNPPPEIQTGTIRQVMAGAEEILGPGWTATWDCQPASAYDTAVYAAADAPLPAANLLTGDAAAFEGGIANWVQAGNCTVAHSTAAAHSGSGSLAATSAAAGPVEAGSCLRASAATQGFACQGGDVVYVSAWFLAATTGRTVVAQIDWFDENLNTVNTTAGPIVTDGTGAWVQASARWAAPASARWFRAGFQVNAVGGAGETHYVDDVAIGIVPASRSLADTAGSTLHAAAAAGDTVLTVDTPGVVWDPACSAAPFDLRVEGEHVRVIDISGPPGNSLGGDNATFEASAGTWTNTGGCTVARTTAFAHSGTGAMAMTATVAGTMSAAHCTAANIASQGKPCAPGDAIACSAWLLPNTVGRASQVGAAFYSSSGTALPVVFAPAVATVPYGWTKVAGTVTAPASAAYYRLVIQVAGAAAGEIHFADDAYAGDVSTGAAGRQTFTVIRAVNGVSRAHPAGADVRLAETPRYSAI